MPGPHPPLQKNCDVNLDLHRLCDCARTVLICYCDTAVGCDHFHIMIIYLKTIFKDSQLQILINRWLCHRFSSLMHKIVLWVRYYDACPATWVLCTPKLLVFPLDWQRRRIPKDVCKRTIEILKSARIFKVNCCLKVHNAHLNLVSPIPG